MGALGTTAEKLGGDAAAPPTGSDGHSGASSDGEQWVALTDQMRYARALHHATMPGFC
jgi:hypothetical protein